MLNGWAPAQLLDSYQAERRPVAQRFVAAAAANGRTGPAMLSVAELMGTDEEFAATRDQVAAGIQDAKRIEFHSDGLVFGLGYTAAADAQTTNGSDYLPVAAVGNRLPHARLANGQSLFDRLGPEFTLLGPAEHTAGFRRYAMEHDIPLALVEHGQDLVLVRPDQHIAWIGGPVPDADAARILDRAIRGDLSTS